MSNTTFWNRVDRCSHAHISPDYLVSVRCSTPYCDGQEIHCLDCGVFISECGCGAEDGMDGWSNARRAKQERQHVRRA